MNRRILKKLCKRAMAVLIAEHGFTADAFSPSDGQETVGAPKGMDRRHVCKGTGSLHPGPLKGTPICWQRTSIEYDEWDCELPTAILADIIFWNNFDYDAWEKAHGAEAA